MSTSPTFVVDGIHIRFALQALTLQQRHLFHLLLWHHLQTDQGGANCLMPLDFLQEQLDFKGQATSQVLLACQALTEGYLHWSISAAAADAGPENGLCPLLAQCWCDQHGLHYSFPSRLRHFLNEPATYDALRPHLQSLFQQRYSQRLYHVLEPLADVGTLGWWTLNHFFDKLGASADEVEPGLENIRKSLIDPSLDEINALSDLLVKVHYRRDADRNPAIKFEVRAKHGLLKEQCLRLPRARQEDLDRRQALEQDFETYKAAKVCELTTTMTSDELARLQAAFVQTIADNEILMKKFERDGFDNLTVKLRYEAFLEDTLLPAEQRDMAIYRASLQDSPTD
jgi:hypothetical protein